MVWFAHPVLGFAIFSPIAAAVLLFEWSHMDYSTPKGKALLPYHVLGGALLTALLAAALAAVGAGLAMSFALWAVAAMIMALCVSKVGLVVTRRIAREPRCCLPV